MPARQGALDHIFKSYEDGDLANGRRLIKQTIRDGRFPIHHLILDLKDRISESLTSTPKRSEAGEDSDCSVSSAPPSPMKSPHLNRLAQAMRISAMEKLDKEYGDEKKDTVPLLFYVAMKGDLESVKLLVGQGYDIFGNDAYGNNIFHYLHLNQNGDEAVKIFVYLQKKIYKKSGEQGPKKLTELLLQKNYYPGISKDDEKNKYAVNPLELADLRMISNEFLCCEEIRDFLGVDYDAQSSIILPGIKTDLKISSAMEISELGQVLQSDRSMIIFLPNYEIEKLATNPNPLLLEGLIDHGNVDIKQYHLLHHSVRINNQNAVHLILNKLRDKRIEALTSEAYKGQRGHNPLQIAVRQNDKDLITTLLSESTDYEIELLAKIKCSKGEFKGYNALMIAILDNKEQSATALLEIAPSILELEINENSYSSLELAIILEREEIVAKIAQDLDDENLLKALSQKVKVPNRKYNGRNLLDVASKCKNVNIFKAILSKIPSSSIAILSGKYDVEQNLTEYNLLHDLAIEENNEAFNAIIENLDDEDLYKLIIQRVNDQTSQYDGFNILHILIHRNDNQILDLIIRKIPQDALFDLLNEKTLRNQAACYNALQLAIIYGNHQAVELITFSINTNDKSKLVKEKVANESSEYNGYNSLNIASHLDQKVDVYRLLQDLAKEECSKIIANENLEGLNELHISSISRKDELFELISTNLSKKDRIEISAKIIKNQNSYYNGQNLFHIIISLGQTGNLSILLKDVSEKNINRVLQIKSNGFNVLHIACQTRSEEILTALNHYLTYENKLALISQRIPDDSSRYQGYNVLDLIALLGRSGFVNILFSKEEDQQRLEALAKPMAIESLAGCNSLHLAVETQGRKILKELLFGHNQNQMELSYLQKSIIFQSANDGIYTDHNPFQIAVKSSEIGFIDSLLQIFTPEDQLEIILHQPSSGKFAGLNLLHFAAIYGDKHAIIGLVTGIPQYKEAILSSTSNQEETKGFNALHLASKYDNISAIEGLRALGIDTEAQISFNSNKDLNGLNALQIAAVYNSTNSIPTLAGGDNIHQQVSNPESEYNGRSAFDIGTSPFKTRKLAEILHELNLQYHISPEKQTTLPGSSPSTPFTEIARMLFGPATP